MEPPAGEVTLLLRLAAAGDRDAQNQVLARLLPELRRMARARMRLEDPGHSWSPTDLLIEAWKRVSRQRNPPQNADQFKALFATMMRRVLCDHARHKAAEPERVTLDSNLPMRGKQIELVLALEESLEKLKQASPRQAAVVELHFFGCLEFQEVAEQLNLSLSTVESEWRFARVWLYDQLKHRNGGRP